MDGEDQIFRFAIEPDRYFALLLPGKRVLDGIGHQFVDQKRKRDQFRQVEFGVVHLNDADDVLRARRFQDVGNQAFQISRQRLIEDIEIVKTALDPRHGFEAPSGAARGPAGSSDVLFKGTGPDIEASSRNAA